MTPVLVTGPSIEPVSLAELKLWLRVSDNDEDDLIAGLITAARLMLEADTHLLFIAQTWRIRLDQWPSGEVFNIPLSPLRNIEEIKIYDRNNIAVTVSPQNYFVDASPGTARVFFTGAQPQPERRIAGIEIAGSFGFGVTPDEVPDPIRLALRMLAARWYENRGDATADSAGLPSEIASLVAPYRRMRL